MRNAGSGVLVVLVVMVLCGCVAPRQSATQVLAGGKAVLLSGVWSKGQDTTLPRPVTSKYFKTYSGGFQLTEEGAFYQLFADVIQNRDKTLYMVADFQDPLDPTRSIRYENAIEPASRSIELRHGPVRGLKIFQGYWVKVTLYESKDSQVPLDVFTQNIRSLVDTQGEQPVVYGSVVEKK